MTTKVRWKTISEGKYRAAGIGTILERPTGFFFYRQGERKSTGGPFKTKKRAVECAMGSTSAAAT